MVQLYQFPIRRRVKGSLWLEAITLSDMGSYIRPHGWLVITLGMGPMRQSSTAWVVSAYSFVELC